MIIKFNYNDKVYSFDDDVLSMSEARFAKRVYGLNTKEMMEGFRNLDVDAVLALLSIALRRGGLPVDSYEELGLDDKSYYDILGTISVESGEAADFVPNRATKRAAAKSPAKG